MLIDLIKSAPMQRLKKIQQQGVPVSMLLSSMPHYSRYEHSIGVMLLLRKLNASLEEQVAGLLHDVSHTAFSHVIDEVLGDVVNQDYQDNRHRNYIFSSQLFKILKDNGFDPSRICDLERYGLLEREAPDLCADRVDNILRYWQHMGRKRFAQNSLSGLMVFNDEIICRSTSKAKALGNAYLEMFWEGRGWGNEGVDLRIRLYLFSRALRIAIKHKILSVNDFNKNDEWVLRKMLAVKDPEISRMISLLKKKSKFRASNNPEFYLKYKFRYVDPKYFNGHVALKLSNQDASYRKAIALAREKGKRGVGYRASAELAEK